ncbi:iron-containing alcohol dehydrogenase [Enterococcus sp. MJM12]|uniref:Iron-containing alcohol dehydrogenase n=1 Tax=Candidatus Enterococcus myersii TaxID=2815322 RepID=A0ABS3H4N8_9ENTE|nr:iron-containing alcohol dehydrogenase [Enterococcus sp. MJM12]MBO0448396.1 iron-containing alcohol dehydrogenase [Enterococcus sp. MJM12]
MYQITLPQKIVYGNQAIHETGKIASKFGLKTLIITDKLIVSLNLLEDVLFSLKEEKLDWKIFDGVDREPTDEIVTAALAFYHRGSYDSIIAVGGGSCIDTAKAVAVLTHNTGSYADFAIGKAIVQKPLPLIAIPTTAGTGSEVTDVTVITDTQKDIKYMMKQAAFLPYAAIIDPQMSRTSPAFVTASTGLDSLCHALESFISKQAQPITKLFSLSAIKLIMENLTVAYAEPDNLVARGNLAQAAMEAGIAFSNASVTLIHGMSRPVGALYHIPHGISNAILLEAVINYTKPAIISELAAIAKYLNPDKKGTDHDLAECFFQDLQELIRRLEVPSYTSFGIEKKDFVKSLDKMANDAIASGSPSNNPIVPTLDEIKTIYLASWQD